MQKEKRKRKNMMCVYLTDEEYQEIIKSSEQSGLSISTFARNVCLGYKVESVEDCRTRLDLLKFHADLGRLGGLYKLALSENNEPQRVRLLLRELELLQRELKGKIKAL